MNRPRFRFVLYQFLFYIVLQMLIRLTLFGMSLRVADLQPVDVLKTFAIGGFYDTVIGAFLCVPLGMAVVLLPYEWLKKLKGRACIYAILIVTNVIILLTAWSQIVFWNEFQSNLNYLFMNYLLGKTGNTDVLVLFKSMGLVLSVMVILSFVMSFVQMRSFPSAFLPMRWKSRGTALLGMILIPVIAAGISQDAWRSQASDNRYNMEIAGNGVYSLAHAFANQNLDYESHYAIQNEKRIIGKLRALLQTSNSTFTEEQGVCRNIVNENELTAKKPNVVVIVVGNISYGRIGVGGEWKPVVPYLEELERDAYVYSNVLSVSGQAEKAMEAIAFSMPPLPGKSTWGYGGNKDLLTLAAILKQHGYTNDFLYGGYGSFASMNDYFTAMGTTSIDSLSMQSKNFFDTEWARVPDETLYQQLLDKIDKHYDQGETAAEVVLTSSNSYPFEFPEGRVDASSGTREGAAMYSDWALHQFMEQASQKPWFDNTVFVIVADHESKMSGHMDLSIYQYRIPFILYAPKLIKPGVNNRLMSQIDITPTLLGRLGISYQSHFLGQNIDYVPPGKERAFISTYQHLGYIKDRYLVVLSPGKQVKTYEIGSWNYNDLIPVDNKPALTSEAITWYQGTSYLVKRGM